MRVLTRDVQAEWCEGEIAQAGDAEASGASRIQSTPFTHGASALRRDLTRLALDYARLEGCVCESTETHSPSVVFGQDAAGRHGNFHPESFRAIAGKPEWSRRLEKAHTGWKRQWYRSSWQWRELDCAHSSDALLMSIFCHPETLLGQRTRLLLGLHADDEAVFGYKPRTPLMGGKVDATEIDLKLGDLLIEAKLTEGDFQACRPALLERYRDLADVFDVAELPVQGGRHVGYQLIRGTLAAAATGGRFCVLCDARRLDLIEGWYRILRCVRRADVRSRLQLLTWQELAMTLPAPLQDFLQMKYGFREGV